MARGQAQVDPQRLAHTVRAYTSRVVADFARQGTPVDIVQIGNEITAGILWPTGRVYRPDGEHWEPLAALLDAGITGARQGNPGNHSLSVMLHIDRGAHVLPVLERLAR